MFGSKYLDSPIPSNIHTARTIAIFNKEVVNLHFSTTLWGVSSILNPKVLQGPADFLQESIIVISEHLLHW
jgi:hypothetical protein